MIRHVFGGGEAGSGLELWRHSASFPDLPKVTCEDRDLNLYLIYPGKVQAKDSIMTSKVRGEVCQTGKQGWGKAQQIWSYLIFTYSFSCMSLTTTTSQPQCPGSESCILVLFSAFRLGWGESFNHKISYCIETVASLYNTFNCKINTRMVCCSTFYSMCLDLE